MKKCPYCAEEIQEEAIKCKHCGGWLEKKRGNISKDKINMSSPPANTQKDSEIITEDIPIIQEEIVKKDTPKWLKTLHIFILIIIGIAFFGNTAAVLISPKPPLAMTWFGFSFWCGVAAAVVAKMKRKSGWLWFFIGFIPIGGSIVFILSFLRAVLQNY